jgi:hypothetical protein
VHYFDEDEKFWKSRYLLEGSLAELHRLSRVGPVVVTVRSPLRQEPMYLQVLKGLRGMTDRVIEFVPVTSPQQMHMF